MPTELTVPMSAVSTPRARGGLCLKGRNLSWVGGGRVAVAWANGRASLDFAFLQRKKTAGVHTSEEIAQLTLAHGMHLTCGESQSSLLF